MSDPSSLSDADLIAQIQAAQRTQNQTAATHTGTGGFDPNDNAWMDQWGPLAGQNAYQKIAAGVGRGMVHTGRSVGNLFGLVPDSAMAEEKKYDAPLLASGAGKTGNLIGESAVTAPLGMGASQGLGMLGKAGASLAANPISNAALQGGMQGLATADPGERGANTAIGSLTGGALGANQILMGKLLRGMSRTPDAQTLLNHGVSLTPGQLNPTGAMNQFEQAAESLPGAKQIIEPAREAAEHQYQAIIIGKGAAPGSAPLKPGNIHDLLQQAYDSYQPLYDQAKGYPVSPQIMRVQGGNVPLADTFQAAARAPGVPKSLQNSENSWLQDRLTQLPKNPQSEDLLQLRSDIRQRARMANLKTDTDSGHVANINQRAEKGVTAALNSQLPTQPLQALASADSNYGNYKIIENAVAKSKDNIAGLTPQKLSQAIYESAQDPAYARGAGGPLRNLAQAGTQVFQNVSPPTGARLATLALGAAGAMHPAVGIPAVVGALGLTGTQTGRKLAAGMTAPQLKAQQLAAALQRNVSAPVRNVGGQLAMRGATGAGMPVTQAALPQALAAALLLAPKHEKKQ